MVDNPYFDDITNPPRFPVSPGRYPAEPTGPWHTPDIPPLWPVPSPPIINTQAPVDVWFGFPRDPLPQRPPIGGPMPTRPPNSRNPITGAPTWRPELGNNPLPPSWNVQSAATGRHPITGAPNYVPERIPSGWWPVGNRPMHTGNGPVDPGWRRTPAMSERHGEDAPPVQPPLGDDC